MDFVICEYGDMGHIYVIYYFSYMTEWNWIQPSHNLYCMFLLYTPFQINMDKKYMLSNREVCACVCVCGGGGGYQVTGNEFDINISVIKMASENH